MSKQGADGHPLPLQSFALQPTSPSILQDTEGANGRLAQTWRHKELMVSACHVKVLVINHKIAYDCFFSFKRYSATPCLLSSATQQKSHPGVNRANIRMLDHRQGPCRSVQPCLAWQVSPVSQVSRHLQEFQTCLGSRCTRCFPRSQGPDKRAAGRRKTGTTHRSKLSANHFQTLAGRVRMQKLLLPRLQPNGADCQPGLCDPTAF